MPTYAESKSAPETHGHPIYYRLLSLDEALAEERSALGEDRAGMGDEGWDAYVESQLDMVRSSYDRGSAWGTAYSVRAPEGEFSTTIPGSDLLPLSRERFDELEASGWRP